MGGPKCPSKNRIDNKIVVITGPTSGIGYEISKQLAQRGFYYYLFSVIDVSNSIYFLRRAYNISM